MPSKTKLIKEFFMTHFINLGICDNSTKIKCEMCNHHSISFYYLQLINRLKQNNLLSEDYAPRCCFCDFLINGESKIIRYIQFDNLGTHIYVNSSNIKIIFSRCYLESLHSRNTSLFLKYLKLCRHHRVD